MDRGIRHAQLEHIEAIEKRLWSDKTGLPVNAYTENEVGVKAEDVFRHVYRAYPTVPSPFYAAAI